MSLVRVNYDEVGLLTKWGALTGDVYEPGAHLRIPVIYGVRRVPVAIRSYETSSNPESSLADYRDFPITAQTVDGQQIEIRFTVIFRVTSDSALEAIRNAGSFNAIVENVVKAHSRSLARTIAQQYSAEELYSGDGIVGYQDEVERQLTEEFSEYNVVLEDFLVRKIDFDQNYTDAIEQQQIAEEAIETAEYRAQAAEHERDQQITMAEAEAERARLNAQAEADSQRLLADAEAYSIEVRGAALRQYPELVQWQFVQGLDSVDWGIMPSDGITPLIPVPEVGE
jgi:regulator of protease activity HflC (stomatin/prohibitin superfamily)